MSTEKIIFIVLIIIIFFVYYIISSMLKYKGIRENNERGYSVEISKGIIIKVLPSSIIGRS